MIHLSAVRLFIRVIDHGGIAPAARELGIAPSVASRQLAALDRWFGTPLLLRTTRRLTLTQSGTLFLEWARAANTGFEELSDELGAMRHHPAGTIRLSCNDYIATAMLPSMLASFCQAYPDVRIQLRTSNDPAALLRDDCDLAIHAGRAPDADVAGRQVLAYRRRLCAAPAYLARRGTPRSITDLAQHDCITHAHGERTAWSFLAEGAVVTQEINPYVECDNFGTIIELARAGLAIARLAETILTKQFEAGALVEVLPQFPCVYPDGGQPGTWLLFPNRRVMFRTRLLTQHISDQMST